jgi:hypothetical protein
MAKQGVGGYVSMFKPEEVSHDSQRLSSFSQFRQNSSNCQLDEAIKNPESRKKLRDMMNTDKGRKGDASKGENPRSKYPSERSKQALNLLHGSGETGSKGNPVRSRGGTNAPADERVGKGPNRAKNAAYWASNAGPTRDRGAGNKAKRRVAELSKEEFEIEEGMSLKDFKANRRNIKRREASADAKSRGHVSKIDVTHGRTYSSDEAKSRRANMSDDERATRKSVAMNPDQVGDTGETADKTKNQNKLRKQKAMGESAAWQRKEGKNQKGGLNEKGRKSYERENPGSDLKAPQPEGGSRRNSFCARMKGMKAKLTSAKTARDPDSRINKSLRAWNC